MWACTTARMCSWGGESERCAGSLVAQRHDVLTVSSVDSGDRVRLRCWWRRLWREGASVGVGDGLGGECCCFLRLDAERLEHATQDADPVLGRVFAVDDPARCKHQPAEHQVDGAVI